MGNEIRCIRNGCVLLPNGELGKTNIVIRYGKISDIGPDEYAEPCLDADGAYILPGIIDLHVHGIEYQSVSEGNLSTMSSTEARHGATTFYPALFGPPDVITEQMHRHLLESHDLQLTPQIGGFRLESPYIACTGAGTGNDLAPIALETTDALLNAGNGHIGIWDISPELPGAIELIHRLSRKGIVCSLAHTDASVEQAKSAVDAGARLVTHLFDTFSVPQMMDPGVYPAGLVDYLLIEDRVTCEIIADGTHVHPILIEKAIRCKPSHGVAFITDGNLGSGLPPGDYSLPGAWGNVRVVGPDNGVRLMDRDMALAGSALTPIDAFRNAILLFGQDIASASRLCSANPARLMGLNKGEIAVGKDADLILLSDTLELLHTVSLGKLIYSCEQ